MAAGRNSGSAWSVVVVLLVCVVTGIVQGARGVVHRAGDADTGLTGSSSTLSIDNAGAFDGTLEIGTSLCSDTPDALDQVRYRVHDGAHRVVARVDMPLVGGRERQSARLGRNLPEGTYRVDVTCLANGEPTDRSERITQHVGRAPGGAGQRPDRMPATGR